MFSQEKKLNHSPKIGLVLSGGGAKGYAHIGVLKYIEEKKIPIDYIGGTSMGAIVGSLYAIGYSAKEIEEILYHIDFDRVIFEEKPYDKIPLFKKENDQKYIINLAFYHFQFSLPKSLSEGQETLNLLSQYLSPVHEIQDFDSLQIPFLCIATNLETGKQKIFRKGFLPKAVLASGSYPTLFSPVEINDSIYTDGGVVNNFPVEEVRKMGADYIIGVDLGNGLYSEKQLTDITKVIEQIVSFRIESKTNEQRKLVDLHIQPDTKNVSVTDFELKESVIHSGYRAASKLNHKFDSLAAATQAAVQRKALLDYNKPYLIKTINIEGLQNFSKAYVQGNLKIKSLQVVKYEDIIEGIKTLYASNNFIKIRHRLSKNLDGTYDLNLNVKENNQKYYAKLGLHYDDVYKSALLLNLTANNLVTINSSLSFDFIFGDNPRYNFHYFVDNGIKPSFGFNSKYNNFSIETDFNQSVDATYTYRVRNIVNQLYVQSTFFHHYAGGLGLEHDYYKIYTVNLPVSDENQTLQNADFISPYLYLKANELDNPTFPSRGFKFDAVYKYLISSNAENFERNSFVLSKLDLNFPLGSRFTLQAHSTLGLAFGNNLPTGFQFGLGGLNDQIINNSIPFYGLPIYHTANNNLFSLGLGMQYKLLKNHYIKLNANTANLETNIDDLQLFDFDYSGIGFTYGYDSALGPLKGTISYSPDTQRLETFLSLGYSF